MFDFRNSYFVMTDTSLDNVPHTLVGVNMSPHSVLLQSVLSDSVALIVLPY